MQALADRYKHVGHPRLLGALAAFHVSAAVDMAGTAARCPVDPSSQVGLVQLHGCASCTVSSPNMQR
jgi:hypothetical protein